MRNHHRFAKLAAVVSLLAPLGALGFSNVTGCGSSEGNAPAPSTDAGSDLTDAPPSLPPDGSSATDDAATCTADVATDPKNCGRCGHDCFGGTCTAGSCGAVPIATGEGEVDGIAVTETSIFFTSYHKEHLSTCTLPCSGGAKELTKGTGPVIGVAVDATSAYFTDWAEGGSDGMIRKCILPDCAGGPISVVTNLSRPGAVVLTPTQLYFGGYGSPAVGTCSLGCVNSPGTSIAPSQSYLISAAASTDSLYWTIAGAPDTATGAVRKCALPDCTGGPKSLVEGVDDPRQLALSSTDVLYATRTAIMRCSLPDCVGGATPVLSGLDKPYGVAVASNTLFWTTKAGLFSCELPACSSPEPVAPNPASASFGARVETNGKVVVWSDGTGGVQMIAKP